MLTSNLKERFKEETRLIHKYTNWAKWINSDNLPYIEGRISNNYGDFFVLRIEISPHFPFEEPILYVMSPHWLSKFLNLGYINDENKYSHEFHTLNNGPMGQVRICHTSSWKASMSLVSVLIKGIIWINAYGLYYRTGRSLCDCVDFDSLQSLAKEPCKYLNHPIFPFQTNQVKTMSWQEKSLKPIEVMYL